MGTYYPELLLDVCINCGLGLMKDIGPGKKICEKCNTQETTMEMTDFEKRSEERIQ